MSREGLAAIAAQLARGQVDLLRAPVLAEALGLRVGARRGGDALAEQAADDEVEGEQVGKLVPFDLERRGLRDELVAAAK